jgi:hypothetical protein
MTLHKAMTNQHTLLDDEVRVGDWIVYLAWVTQYEDKLMWLDHLHLEEGLELPHGTKYNPEKKIVCRTCGEEAPKGVERYAAALKLFKHIDNTVC